MVHREKCFNPPEEQAIDNSVLIPDKNITFAPDLAKLCIYNVLNYRYNMKQIDPPFCEGGIIQASPRSPGVKIEQGDQPSSKKPEIHTCDSTM